MDEFVFIGGIVLFVLLGPCVLVWRVNARRKRERQEDQERWRDLTSRIYAFEQAVQKTQSPSPAPEEATAKRLEHRSRLGLLHRPLRHLLPHQSLSHQSQSHPSMNRAHPCGSPRTGSRKKHPNPRRHIPRPPIE